MIFPRTIATRAALSTCAAACAFALVPAAPALAQQNHATTREFLSVCRRDFDTCEKAVVVHLYDAQGCEADALSHSHDSAEALTRKLVGWLANPPELADDDWEESIQFAMSALWPCQDWPVQTPTV